MNKTTDIATQAHEELKRFILGNAPSAKLFEHPASKTSEESIEARRQASGERVTGAKALLIKLDVRDRSNVYAVIVLPGFNKLDSKATKLALKKHISGLRGFRFATPEEMEQHARGMQPGKMPPFGKPIFPNIEYTFIDKALIKHRRIGFNASHFEKSIIMDTTDYLHIVPHDAIFLCSTE